MLKVIRATVLVLTLSGSVFAGDIQNGVQPTPTPQARMAEEPAEVLVIEEQQSPTTTLEITLDLVQIVLALF